MLKRIFRIGGITVLVLLVLLATAVAALLCARGLARQANEGLGRIVSPQGIDRAGYVTIGGVRQWITMRGQDRDHPILLFLHGGPGNPTSDLSYSFQRPWEDYFTVVQWDQRPFGRSGIDAQAMQQPVTKDRLVADTIELIEHLRRELQQPKVVLVGHSWGTILGASVAARRPDLLYAYVGIAQVVSWQGGFLETRRQLLELAERTGDAALSAAMREAGPPPGEDIQAGMEWIGKIQAPAARRGGAWHNLRGEDFLSVSLTLLLTSPSLTLGDIWSSMRPSSPETFYFPLVRTVVDWDFRRDVGLDLQVPIVLIAGRHDMASPLTLVRVLERELRAPCASLIVLEHSAHMPMYEQPGRLLGALLGQVLPLTRGEPCGA